MFPAARGSRWTPRKIAGIEAYSPTDNVPELTARINDEGWASVFANWLKGSRLNARDAVLVFSVGGGSVSPNVSPNIVAALDYTKSVGAASIGIVGRDGGHTAKTADVCILIPVLHHERITPHTEAFQAIVWHLLVSRAQWQGPESAGVAACFVAANLVWAMSGIAWSQRLRRRYAEVAGHAFDSLPALLLSVALALATAAAVSTAAL